ncbi:MAG: glycosyltransferase family 2 protein [Planctomycetes bacterium]|nr:glycosyltransferase family 2 protein [Planctomycetota bacterium]
MSYLTLLQTIFVLAFCLLAYVYLGYPLLLAVLARIRPRPVEADPSYTPGVSLIIAAHNEEKVIEHKIRNSLELDYPKDKLEIIVASDGSDDGTNEICRRYEARGVRLNVVTPRGGKLRAIKLTVPTAEHDVIVFSDANAMYQPDSIRALVAFLRDDRVGAVTGDVRLVNGTEKLRDCESLYCKYDRWIKTRESKISSVIGADGAMYAIKRSLFKPPADHVPVDDVVIPMNVVRQGYRVVYSPRAIAYEDGTQTISEEIARRARYTEAGLRAFSQGEGVPRWWQLTEWFMYISHKLLRWLAPLFVLALFGINVALLGHPVWNAIFSLQIGFYLTCVFAASSARARAVFLCKLPFYFTVQHIGGLLGILRWLFAKGGCGWESPERSAVAPSLDAPRR